MPNFVHILLRVLAGIAGALLLYIAFFLYEDEEARIQNRLEQIWRKINELQSVSVSREAAFLKGASAVASRILDRLLGPQLFSLRFVAASAVLSSLSIMVFTLSLELLTHDVDLMFSVSMVLVLLILCWVVLQSGKSSRSVQLFVFLFCPMVALSLITRVGDLFFGSPYYDPFPLTVPILIGCLVTDMLFVVMFRWVLKTIRALESVVGILACTLPIIVLAFVATLPSGMFFQQVVRNSQFQGVGVLHQSLLTALKQDMQAGVYVLVIWSTSNWLDGACALLLIGVMMVLLLHRLIWPVIKRPVYAANRKQLIKNSKLLGALGTMLLLYAFPNNPVVKWLTEFLPKVKGT